MRARKTSVGLVVAALLVTGARCGPDELTALQRALANEGGISTSLLDDARNALKLSDLSADDLALRRQLLAEVDTRILASAVAAMDSTVTSARGRAEAEAAQIAVDATADSVPSKFTADLEDVTKEMVKEEACQAVLDQVAPAPDEPGVQKSWTDMVGEVVSRMVERRWKQPTDQWQQFVAWEDYAARVTKDGQQLSNALLSDPTKIELFVKPPAQRAALAYARFCYESPKLP